MGECQENKYVDSYGTRVFLQHPEPKESKCELY